MGVRYGFINENEELAIAAVHRAIDVGLHGFDTAPAYLGGYSLQDSPPSLSSFLN